MDSTEIIDLSFNPLQRRGVSFVLGAKADAPGVRHWGMQAVLADHDANSSDGIWPNESESMEGVVEETGAAPESNLKKTESTKKREEKEGTGAKRIVKKKGASSSAPSHAAKKTKATQKSHVKTTPKRHKRVVHGKDCSGFYVCHLDHPHDHGIAEMLRVRSKRNDRCGVAISAANIFRGLQQARRES